MKVKAGLETEYAQYVAKNSNDGYSRGVVDYGEKWAALMEARLEAGETIPQCAEVTSHTADTDGITGFMYGCAVSALAKFWEHGETLRRWHNKETQIGTEGDRANETGGTLNPALMTVQV
jgi:hypothetical protein